jgi:hypothetical protein
MNNQPVTKEFETAVNRVIEKVDATADKLEENLESKIKPVRRRLFHRFPVLSLLAITFGVTAVFTGIEQILLKNNLLQTHPWLILLSGIVVLFLTGTLYKKLG